MAKPKLDVYVYSNELREHGSGRLIEAFSSHWAAVAVMLRLNDPDFKSSKWNLDKPEDLEKETRL